MIERSVTVNGLDLVIAEAGAGGRPLLLVHGFGGAKEDFTDYLDRFAELGWHAVTLDNRGHGSSAKPESEDDYSLELLADDLDKLFDLLGWSDATILGHSMGGMVVQLFVLAKPERCNALILMDTAHKIPDSVDPDMIATAQQIVRDGGIELLVEIQDKAEGPSPLDTPAYIKLCAEDPAYAAWSRSKTLNTASPAWVGLAGNMATQADRLDALAAIAVPTLVIVGEQDAGFIDQCRAMANKIPGAAIAVIADGGHSPQFENPSAWWDAMASFLAARTA